jgi:hypothetical protein
MSYRIDLFCEDLRQKLTIIESGLQGSAAAMFSAVRCTLFTYCSRQCLDSATAQAAGRPDSAERAGAQSRPAQ